MRKNNIKLKMRKNNIKLKMIVVLHDIISECLSDIHDTIGMYLSLIHI